MIKILDEKDVEIVHLRAMVTTVESQRNALAALVEGLRGALTQITDVYEATRKSLVDKYPQDGWSAETMSIDKARVALTQTPPAALAEHDAEVLERFSKVLRNRVRESAVAGARDSGLYQDDASCVVWCDVAQAVFDDEIDRLRAGGEGETR